MAPLPVRPQYSEGKFRNRRGQKLFYSSFFPANSARDGVEGVVLFMHGINEHSHRFTHVYEQLVALRFGVIAYDMVGHGKSECDVPDLRAHSEQFQHMVDDTNDFLTAAKYSIYRANLPESQQQPPLYFMGISYGCLVGTHTVLSGVHPFSGMIMASPALGVEQTLVLRLQNLISTPLVKAMPHGRIVPGVNFDGLSRNASFVNDYMNDPLNFTGNMTARMGVLSFEAMKTLMANTDVEDRASAFCKMPVLILQGTADTVTSAKIARAFYDRIANFDKTMIEYEGLFHCVFNEPEREQVLDDATKWLVAHARQYHQLAKAQKEAKPLVARL